MDIDIDVADVDVGYVFPSAIKASRVDNNTKQLIAHNVGWHFQDVPIDTYTELCAIPYNKVDDVGLTKIDLLHLSILDDAVGFSREQLLLLANTAPDWNMLLVEDVVITLFQISNRFDVVSQIAPKSVMELADCISIIRPSRLHLLSAYLADRNQTRPLLYQPPYQPGTFKKGHAIAYAKTIVMQLNMIRIGRITVDGYTPDVKVLERSYDVLEL